MRRLIETDGLTDLQRDILGTVTDFVNAEVLPAATELDHADAYPDALVHRLRDLGVFGLTISEQYGGLGESLLTYASTTAGYRPPASSARRPAAASTRSLKWAAAPPFPYPGSYAAAARGVSRYTTSMATRARDDARLSRRLTTVTRTPRSHRFAAARPNTPSPDPITT